ncbi:hypothetical protein AU467_23965 [Mesorhizobium loti]|uniref:Serine protease n=1 Tax=Rhizobium loti TaxID=381 RepID=A0A101KS57_RHILI|nr:hypothetical protein AU467_23965 [Mesorhizobium loti]
MSDEKLRESGTSAAISASPTRKTALDFFGRHLIALCVSYRDRADTAAGLQPRVAVFSGTLFEFRGTVSILTAGHILRWIERMEKSSEIEILGASIADVFSADIKCDHPIPLDLKGAIRNYVDEAGLDFGLILLRPYYVRLLAFNGTKAIGEEVWAPRPDVNFGAHFILGLPAEIQSQRISDEGNIALSPILLRVRELNEDGGADFPRFVGQIDDMPLQSIEGMSGGPIIGFDLSSPDRYWIVALQSAWLPTSRKVFGCPMPVIGKLLTEAVNDLLNDLGSGVVDTAASVGAETDGVAAPTG